jgi:hypothetical protein
VAGERLYCGRGVGEFSFEEIDDLEYCGIYRRLIQVYLLECRGPQLL